MAVYNSVDYLAEALGSISAQSFTDFELVAIDDGSTDGSGALLRAHAAHEPRMRVISRENRGLIATRNELLTEARGTFIAWMDSDDISLPDRLEQQVAAVEADSAIVAVGTQADLIDPAGRRLGPEQWPTGDDAIRLSQRTGGGMRFPSTMMRRAAASGIGGFREPFRMGEDLDFLLRLGERGKLANLPATLYLYRQHPQSTCLAFGGGWQQIRDAILQLANERREEGTDRLQRGEHLDLPVSRTTASNRRLYEVYASWSERARFFNERRVSLRYALKSVAAAPLRLRSWRALIRSVR